jgi:tetratricopeptide (TPR) repeat protein
MNATISLLGLPLSGARHRFVRHPFYGKLRVVRRPAKGSSKEHWTYDPDYEPELPLGAVRGDVSKQVFCSACHVPKYFYLDKESQCLQCGGSFTFGATEQKYWYETLKFNFHSAAVRCPDCRRLRRSERALREQIAHAKAAIRTAPDDPAPHLALAQALVEYHERTGQGRLDDAVAAARRAARLWPQAPDVLLWEGVAHARAGRTGRARECLTRFLRTTDEPNGSGAKKAKEYLRRAV